VRPQVLLSQLDPPPPCRRDLAETALPPRGLFFALAGFERLLQPRVALRGALGRRANRLANRLLGAGAAGKRSDRQARPQPERLLIQLPLEEEARRPPRAGRSAPAAT